MKSGCTVAIRGELDPEQSVKVSRIALMFPVGLGRELLPPSEGSEVREHPSSGPRLWTSGDVQVASWELLAATQGTFSIWTPAVQSVSSQGRARENQCGDFPLPPLPAHHWPWKARSREEEEGDRRPTYPFPTSRPQVVGQSKPGQGEGLWTDLRLKIWFRTDEVFKHLKTSLKWGGSWGCECLESRGDTQIVIRGQEQRAKQGQLKTKFGVKLSHFYMLRLSLTPFPTMMWAHLCHCTSFYCIS
jgi:hypothetical protein